jgi:hypothetical protein
MKKVIVLIIACFASSMLFANHWVSENPGNYTLVMALNGVIQINGVEQASDQLEVGAFSNGECRGSQMASVFPFTGQYIIMLSIDGENGDMITFKLYDHSTQQELNLSSPEAITFNNDGLGDYFTPYVLNFTTSAITNLYGGDWGDSQIWGGTLPTPESNVLLGDDVIINNGSTVTVAGLEIPDNITLTVETGSVLVVTDELICAQEGGLVIQEDAQVINESANVKATFEKSIHSYVRDNGGWYTIASPMDEMLIEGSDFINYNYDLYRLNETTMMWENYEDPSNTGFTTFENGRGYLYANSQNLTPSFVGTLNATDVTFGVTYTERPDALSGFNLIGNPFPHNIYKGAGGAIDNANLASGFYTLNDEGAWHIHTFDEPILPGQGILVKTTANANLTIAKSNAEATAEASGTKTVEGRLCITVKGENVGDRAFAYFGTGIGLEKVGGFSSTAPSLFIRQDRDYAIAHVDDNEPLEICFHNSQDAEFHISFNLRDISFDHLLLVDLVTGAVTNLLEEPEYVFHADGTEPETRFKLLFETTTGVEETAEDKPFVFVSDGNIIVSNNGEATLQVIDVTGRVLGSETINGNFSKAINVPGVYVLRLINGNEVRTQKIIIE